MAILTVQTGWRPSAVTCFLDKYFQIKSVNQQVMDSRMIYGQHAMLIRRQISRNIGQNGRKHQKLRLYGISATGIHFYKIIFQK